MNKPVNGSKLNMFSHQTNYRVIYGDTDNMGIAYHANYFRWFEIGRTEMLRHLGMTYKAIEKKGYFSPVADVRCRFMAPVHYDDILIIETTLDDTVRGGLKFDYGIFSEDGGTSFARGYTRHACLDLTGRVVRPPHFLRELFDPKKAPRGCKQ